MPLNRFLKYINLLIGLCVIAAAATVYWFVYRPLPETSGEIRTPIGSMAVCERDELGVPHITAGNQTEALFIQGFITAQDRLFQMELARRRAAGELAEIAGAGALDSDRQARLLRIRRLAEQHYQLLTPEERAMFAAYARGVNFFLETNQSRLPVEFSLAGIDPRPWSVVDSILVALQLYRTLAEAWDDELLKQRYLASGDKEKVDYLFPLGIGGDVQPGSNAWAVSGKWTESGKPLLANDPHLQFSIPSIWHQVHLKAGELNVAGFTLPGLPGVLAGHNDRIAWGITNLRFDSQDLYIENFDPSTGRYEANGAVAQARLERELVPVKGQKASEVSIWVTRHGPVVISEGKNHLSLKWTAAEDWGFAYPFMDLNSAGNWEEFTEALSQFPGPAQNFIYADVDGNIGYQAAGRLPVRRSYKGDIPVDGASGKYEWSGFIPFDRLPSAFNPPSGMIISANQNPFPEDYPYQVNGDFAPPYRARQIQALLSSQNEWRAEEMLSIQTDVYSEFLHNLGRQLISAYESRGIESENLTEAVELLREWNGQMERDSPAALLATLLFQHLRKAVAEAASPGAGASFAGQMAPVVVEQLLRDRPVEWFNDYNQLLLRSFVDAIEEGRRMQGDEISKWEYGRENQLLLSHPVINQLPLAGKHFRIGPLGMSGSRDTVKQTTPRSGPSMRMVADLADWDSSLANITFGQSGQILSSHYKDQWEAYLAGTSYPMQFQKVAAKSRLQFIPE